MNTNSTETETFFDQRPSHPAKPAWLVMADKAARLALAELDFYSDLDKSDPQVYAAWVRLTQVAYTAQARLLACRDAHLNGRGDPTAVQP